MKKLVQMKKVYVMALVLLLSAALAVPVLAAGQADPAQNSCQRILFRIKYHHTIGSVNIQPKFSVCHIKPPFSHLLSCTYKNTIFYVICQYFLYV